MNVQARSITRRTVRYAFLIVACCGSWGVQTATVRSDEETPEPVVTKARLTGEIERLQSDATIDADIKQAAMAILKTAIQDSDAGLEAEQRTLRLQRQLETAARELDTLRNKLKALPETAAAAVPDAADSELLERRRDELEQKLDQPENGQRARIARLKKELNDRSERLEAMGNELLEAEDQLKTTQDELEQLPPDNESPVMSAHRLALRVSVQRWEREVAALGVERDWLESTAADRWIRVLLDIAEREVALTESELQQVEQQLETQRRREAAARVEQAQQESHRVPAALKPLAMENQQLAERSRKLSERLETVEDERHLAEKQLETLKTELEEMRQLIEKVGRNDAIGLMLRRQSSRLPDRNILRLQMAAREEEVRELKLKLFEVDRQEQQSPDLDAVVKTARLSAAADQIPFDEAVFQQQAESLLAHRTELLSQLTDDYKSLFNQLFGMVQTERQLLMQSQSMSSYYDEQMLWMRTSSVFGPRDLEHFRDAVLWLGDAAAWQELPADFAQDFEQRPLIYLLAALILAGLVLVGHRGHVSNQRPMNGSLFFAAITAAAMAIRSAMVPFLLACLAWRLEHAGAGSIWRQGISQGLWRCAAWAWPLLFLKSACAADGLGPVQWGWSPIACRRMTRQIGWFLPFSMALLFIVGATEVHGNEVISDSLGRAAFILWMVCGGLFCRTVLSHITTADDPSSEKAWPQLGMNSVQMLTPLILWGIGVLAMAGYYDTALKLAWCVEETFWLGLILAGIHSAVSRWISCEQSRINTLTDTPPAEHSTGARKTLLARFRDSRAVRGPSPAHIARQMHGLLHTGVLVAAVIGIGFLWRPVLPNTGFFDRWPLWHTAVTQQQNEPGDNGSSSIRTVTRLEPVTVFDLGLAALILGVTLAAARNIPGLVETLFCDRIPLDVGGRFAVTILFRYVLFIAGAVSACHQIRLGWANVQWLVAAASVGLGFGLQDIFANFVSGIILLFERPIRVGDVITIGDTTGSVSQIRFRSTTIIDADRKELVVPNKDLITGKLLNWTLSDQTNRLKIRVAVNSQSDPNRVRHLLQEIALAHPLVLKDPQPTATFEEFGANSLVFMLCAFLPSLDDRSQVLHELHSTIHARLQSEGMSTTSPAVSAPPPKNVAA